jgi:stage II sporulation protein D
MSEEAVYLLDETVGEFIVNYTHNTISFRSDRRFFSYQDINKIEFFPINNSSFLWQNVPYHGKLTFLKDEKKIHVINSLPMTQYLKGVVPFEIPTYTEDYYQAIMTQTIAARTYAIYHLQHPASPYFDVYADTRDQVYMGLKRTTPLANKSIEESQGFVLHNKADDPDETPYHSTCGGTLELKLMVENNPSQGFYKDFYQEDFNCITSPLYRWVEKITTRDILKNLKKMNIITIQQEHQWKEIGFQVLVKVLTRSNAGRIDKLAIIIGNKEIILSGWEIRRAFRKSDRGLLPSNLFFLKSSPQEKNTLYLVGAGFGHGRGMCQWGAIGLALKGKNFEEILGFYYPDLKLKKIY